jgi:hypothetical protein
VSTSAYHDHGEEPHYADELKTPDDLHHNWDAAREDQQMQVRQRPTTARLVTGGTSGLVATGVMSALMLGWQRWTGKGRLAPAVVADRALGAVGFAPSRSDTRKGAEVAAHFTFGAGAGAVYAALTPGLLSSVPRAARVPASVRGALFGLGLWAMSYGVAMPALGVLPPPPQDRAGRQPRLVVAHLVFGATLGTLLRRH